MWGDIKGIKKIVTPKAILEEQATFLTSATKGLLVGRVDITSSYISEMESKGFIVTLRILVPVLSNYICDIITVRHLMKLYPLMVINDLKNEKYECGDEASFLSVIETILSSGEVKQTIQLLLSQIEK